MAADCKSFEIRDEGTHVPVLAIKPNAENEQDRYCWARAGYGVNYATQREFVILHRMNDRRTESDPYAWQSARTMLTVHRYILDNWERLQSGQVIDVRYILGEADAPCKSDNARPEVVV